MQIRLPRRFGRSVLRAETNTWPNTSWWSITRTSGPPHRRSGGRRFSLACRSRTTSPACDRHFEAARVRRVPLRGRGGGSSEWRGVRRKRFEIGRAAGGGEGGGDGGGGEGGAGGGG